MTNVPRITVKSILAACLLAAGLLAPVSGAAADSGGGSGYSSGAQYGPGGTGGAQYGAPLGEIGSPALHALGQALLGSTVHFGGSATPGTTVTIQRLDPHTGQWVDAATAQVDDNGAFVADWRANHIGIVSVRAVPGTDAQAHASDADPALRITVYRPALATWYGPGFYGHRTACGGRLTRDTLGVAHRGLPCGRQVALYYRGRTLTVPVVDRGPYGRRDADYDLTAATARALGFTHTDTIGAVSLHPKR
jgi:rare lipoprotein A